MARLCRALYELESTHPNTLAFTEGEKLLVINIKNNDPNWWYASNTTGTIGYIPRSYVTFDEFTSMDLLQGINRTINALQEKICHNSVSLSPKHHHILRELVELRNILEEDSNQKTSALANDVPPTTLEPNTEVKFSDEGHPQLPPEIETNRIIAKSDPCDRFTQTEDENLLENLVPHPALVPEMVEKMRSQSKLNYRMSILSVAGVLESLRLHIPQVSSICNKLLLNLQDHQNNYKTIYKSHDKRRLEEIFELLWSCKNDEQQRSWPIYEDETVIYELLNDMNSILLDADPRVCCSVIQSENYEVVNVLVTYYQMEPRRKLRFSLLKVFESLCRVDEQVVDNLLMSILPMELSREMQHHSHDHERVVKSARILSLILSGDQRATRSLFDQLNKDFAVFLLKGVATALDLTTDEDVSNMQLCVLLSLNLHLNDPKDNFIVQAVREQLEVTALSEKLMLLINREDDPVEVLHNGRGVNSVLKFLVDLFEDEACAKHFYVNDIKVLIDIILRQLTDLPPSITRRNIYHQLISGIISNTEYSEHLHQLQNLSHCFNSILEDEEISQSEKSLVQKMCHAFPEWFLSEK